MLPLVRHSRIACVFRLTAASLVLFCGLLACAQDAATELKTGTELTREGMLDEAIPHLLAARNTGAETYASSFNLAICYLGTGRYAQAAGLLEDLRRGDLNGSDRLAAVNNLLAQAYLGSRQREKARAAFLRAAAATPEDEKLYAFVADACTEQKDYEMGLWVANQGLRQLPDSPRLHYERALFLSRLDRFAEGKTDFERAARLAKGTYLDYLASVQEALFEDRYADALATLRGAVKAGERDYRVLSLLGTVLLEQGAAPGDPSFAEARQALEESAAESPGYSPTQIALGKLYLRDSRWAKAVVHLETGRRLEPNNPEVYKALMTAYRRLGQPDKAAESQAELARLLSAGAP